MTTDVTIRLDDSIRLVSAVLSLTDYPDKVQAAQPHGSHAHARLLRRYLKPHENHEAVKGMQALLDNGAPLEAMFTLVAHLPFPSLQIASLPRWVPPNWNTHLADFYEVSGLSKWWTEEDTPWAAAVEQCERMFEDVTFKPFLSQFLGDITDDLVFMPNIGYPSNREIGMRIHSKELVAVCSPRLAWGDSPPWPFDEDQSYIQRVALSQYLKLIVVPYLRANAEKVGEAAANELPVDDKFRAQYPTWGEQFVNIFMMAAIAIYLEELDTREGRAYIQNKVKIDGVKILPGAVSVFKRYLQERETGKFNELADFMLVFPKQLKVAKRIMSI